MEIPIIRFYSNTKKPSKMVSLHKYKIIIDWKVTPFINNLNIAKKDVKIICGDNTSENKTPEENCANNFKEIGLECLSPRTSHINGVENRYLLHFVTRCAWWWCMQYHTRTSRLAYDPNTRQTWPNLKIMLNPHKEKCVYEKIYVNIPDYAKYVLNLGKWELYTVALA